MTTRILTPTASSPQPSARASGAIAPRPPSTLSSALNPVRGLLHGVALALAALCLAACGGDAPEASDTSVALDGKKLGKASQLQGVWMRVSEGSFTGFEFLKDGKALVTSGRNTSMLDYSVLDGGRLNLSDAAGRANLYSVTLSGDLLELAPESAMAARPPTPQRFQRVKDGKTLAVAAQEHAIAMEEARLRRLAELEKLLAADDLVLVKSEESGPTAVLAIKIDHWKPQIGGTAVMIDDPKRIDALSPVRVHPIVGRIEPMDDFTDRIRISLDVRSATAPAGQEASQGRVILIADGPVEKPSPAGLAEFPKSWPGQATLVLKRDGSVHKMAVAKLEEQQEAARRALAKVADPLGGRAVLSGQKTASRDGKSEPVQVTIERTGDTYNYVARAQIGSAQEQNASVGIELLLGEGALYLSLANGEQWRLQLGEKADSYTGLWRPNARSDFISHGEVELQVERSWTIAEVKAEKEAMERFLSHDLRQPVEFTGFVDVGRPNDPERWPVWVQLQVNEDSSAIGRAWLLGQGLGVELSGRVSGGVISLNSTASMPNSANSRSLAQQRWQLSVSSIDPTPQLSGRMNGTIGGGGPVTIAPIDPKALSAAKKDLLKELKSSSFVVVNTSISRRPNPSYFRFEVDPGTGRISGDAIGEDLTGSTSRALPPGLIVGEIVEERGHALLKLVVDSSPEPVRGRPGERFEFTLAPSRDEDGALGFFGWAPAGRGNQDWLTLAPAPQDIAITVSPEQALRLAAQKLGALAEAPRDPKAGDQAIVIVNVTERDARLGQLFYADGKYTHRNSIPAAAIHAGLALPGEICVLRLSYGPPFTTLVEPVEQNGIASQRGSFRENNPLPTFTLERLAIE